MNKFIEKRDSLENYVKEQVIGPGAYNKKYFFLKDWDKSEYSGKDLTQVPAIQNFDEIIPEVPAYQYSSAILFPVTIQSSEIENRKEEQVVKDEIEDNEEGSSNTSADDENISEDTSSNIVLTQQNYPNTFGLSFVFDKNKNINDDLKISLSYRKYKNVSKKTLLENKIAISIKDYKAEIKHIVTKYLTQDFGIEEKDNNLFVYPKKVFNQDDIYAIDYNLLNAYVRDQFHSVLIQPFDNKIVELNSVEGVKFFGLEDGNKQFYSISDTKYSHSNVFTIFSEAISSFIHRELECGIVHYSLYKDLVKELEIYNQLIQITTDLKTIIKEKNPSPVWESKICNRKITLPKLKGIKIQREKRKAIDEKDKESLQYYVQYLIPKAEENEVYVKILIENTNEYKLKQNEPPQLNKKDKANKLSFFGVELKINETTKKSLLQYNPPQLLDFDEEDSFNKLIYREYIDYGEGYNTSVNWGKSKDSLTFISSDFLPTQETPSVDFKPSKIQGNDIKDRLLDDGILSMRYLSTLNDAKDEEIIEGLNSFIDVYGNEDSVCWIKDKQEALNREIPVDNESKRLLNKQLEACRNDYRRLKRNITLLVRDSEAMAAFRTMNTAMFMQLHHSIESKKNKPFVLNKANSEEYYSNEKIYDKDGKETEYKWRSFQLAFILLNVDAFVKPSKEDDTVEDLFGSGWPERNEIADLVWFPTGGGKTEAYLGIIAFMIALRRFTKGERGYGTTVLMRYTLRMLTLQQFQRATMLICALDVIRKDEFSLPEIFSLGVERISIGLFVGGDSLPNYWSQGDKSMVNELEKISDSIKNRQSISTNLPFTDCPWCGGNLFVDEDLKNIKPNHNGDYGINDRLNIACNTTGCAFHSKRASDSKSLPFRLFDDDIYKFPPTLLFGTVDKFAAFANNVSTESGGRNKDSQRLVGKGYKDRNNERDVLPPELIIQDELHLLLGPLGSSVGLFEKGIDYLCTYKDDNGNKIKPKVVTSTATTRNTDKQIFALFNRRSEIFPKQGITCDDSFFAFYKRKVNEDDILEYESKRKYIGVLPIGKTQVWMQLRIISISLSHRLKYFKEKYTIDQVFETPEILEKLKKVFDYYHTIIAYYNSLKDVGKAQSQLDHYLPGDINYIIKNTIPWSFLDKLIRKEKEIMYSELTGRLSGEEVKTNLADIEKKWSLLETLEVSKKLKKIKSPEFIIATNMISVGIDVSRFNTIVINSMPRNIAEYIQASSRVARDEDGIVFTVHHPYRSRDISHYQKFKEFHEKFYSYVEPISVTPFASKALDRYLAMYAIIIIRHNKELGLKNNDSARDIDNDKIEIIKNLIKLEIQGVYNNYKKLDKHLQTRTAGVTSTIDGIISEEEVNDIDLKLNELLDNWINRLDGSDSIPEIVYRAKQNQSINDALFVNALDDNYSNHWKVSYSLREIGASTVIKTVQQ